MMWILIFGAIVAPFTTGQIPGAPVLDQAYWEQEGSQELNDALNVKLNTGVARNVILFIGDGMGPITVTAGRIHRAGETGHLVWEKFDHVGLLKTYSNDKTVPDSSVTASGMMTGIKGNSGTMGTDNRVLRADCEAGLRKDMWTTSNALIAQQAGKATGVVTNTRVTHATPASVYAHTAERDWECDSVMPATAKACKDIARQLIEDDPGRNLNVIMGGGIQGLISETSNYTNDPTDTWACKRNDSRNLIEEWKTQKMQLSANHAVVHNTGSLKDVDTSKTEYLLGLFGNGHMSFNYLRDKTDKGQPSLSLMATTAVKILNNNPKGFFLMVEGGLIDLAHHKGRAKVALDEVIQLNEAVNDTIRLLEELKIKDETLLIVTSDHCHTLSMNGYPERGNSILGIADKSKKDGISYTTLTYAVSGPENFQYEVVNGKVSRKDPTLDDTESWDYHQQATVLQDESKHGGGDVNVYAIGPMSHLFHNVHEQSYVAHVVQYAAKLGRYKNRDVAPSSSAPTLPFISLTLLMSIFLFLCFESALSNLQSL